RAAKTFLPFIQFRAASGGHGRRHCDFAWHAAFVSTGGSLSLSQFQNGSRPAHSSVARRTDVHHSVAVERDPVSSGAAFSRRRQNRRPIAAHGIGKSFGRSLSTSACLPRTHCRRPRNSRSPVGEPDT